MGGDDERPESEDGAGEHDPLAPGLPDPCALLAPVMAGVFALELYRALRPDAGTTE